MVLSLMCSKTSSICQSFNESTARSDLWTDLDHQGEYSKSSQSFSSSSLSSE